MMDAPSPVAVAERFPLLVIAGATASGKSHLAIQLALAFDGEIVSCDSMQVYRGFDVGTAKVSAAERAVVPHHLIDIRDPAQPFSAGEFAREAAAALAAIRARGRLPILTGGTGFYLRALLEGLPPAPPRDEALRARLAKAAPQALYRLLLRLDPAAAVRIHPHDRHKLIRALEIARGRAPHASPPRPAGLTGFAPVKILLLPDRAALYCRINERVVSLFAGGLLEETAVLQARGLPPTCPPFQAVGYREALAVLSGTLTLEAAVRATQQATRNYAKRQLTWFRRECWTATLPGFGDEPEILAAAIQLVRATCRSGR